MVHLRFSRYSLCLFLNTDVFKYKNKQLVWTLHKMINPVFMEKDSLQIHLVIIMNSFGTANTELNAFRCVFSGNTE